MANDDFQHALGHGVDDLGWRIWLDKAINIETKAVKTVSQISSRAFYTCNQTLYSYRFAKLESSKGTHNHPLPKHPTHIPKPYPQPPSLPSFLPLSTYPNRQPPIPSITLSSLLLPSANTPSSPSSYAPPTGNHTHPHRTQPLP
ncbi:hypothetical protein P171DRAFT_137316 [Karstenula rhodostoma CBS 690.94]|uniref:Uncharacterized protein n=1 Tax=Karstenula rhodostoma CBS 690.94 TaxID=1392251 RepID=A0A9P4PS25_9PLEO|nr:hypothetical protein P171DRAFT_137316 [Karstenula rhodostoma CBS 690.94]